MFFRYGSNNNLDFEINGVLTESWANASPSSWADSKSLTNASEAYVPVCNVRKFWVSGSNGLHFHSSSSGTISWRYCSSICRRDFLLSLCWFLLLMTFIWFSKSVSLRWCCMYSSCEYIVLFRSLVTFSYCSQLWTIVHSIRGSRGIEEYFFPVNNWENIYFISWQCSCDKEDISIQNTSNRICIVIYHYLWHLQFY